ncbi:hypothetical protein ACWDZ6_24195, partial [Streptomyces sp. NPDC002926]
VGVTVAAHELHLSHAYGALSRPVARAHGATAARVRPAWTLQHGPHVPAIPGTGGPDHLVDNVPAGAPRLSADEPVRLGSLHPGGG